jgi:small subunit ribosomal protein S12
MLNHVFGALRQMSALVARPATSLLQSSATIRPLIVTAQRACANVRGEITDRFGMYLLKKMHDQGPLMPRKLRARHPLQGKPQMRGIVLKTVIKKPKKPNSANRKCVLVRLTNGQEKICFVPGIGHNLQEHSTVLVQTKRVKDVPGLKLRCIRGAKDLMHVIKKSQI